ncbi:hypothetical protein [Nostoc sp. ChiQUE01b]|nr:hypothetical protein [Nostoc sp. ChiQUE01b]MDZ8264578.1 hypothetical protein [Nostoc sp. ChiQUE01b]
MNSGNRLLNSGNRLLIRAVWLGGEPIDKYYVGSLLGDRLTHAEYDKDK